MSRMKDLLVASARLGLEPFLRGGWQSVGWVLGEIVIAVSSIAAPLLLVERFGSIGTWSAADMQLLIGFALTVRGAAFVFSGRQVMMISRKIARGQLDHLLIQPQPLWRALATEGFSPFDLAVTLVLGVIALISGILRQQDLVSAWWLLSVPLSLISATLIYIATQYLWGSMAFFAPQGAEEVNTATASALSQISVYPLGSLPGGMFVALSTILPVTFLAWMPVSGLLSDSWMPLAVTPLFAVAFCLFTLFIFRKGLQNYAKRGVARYSDFGHRR